MVASTVMVEQDQHQDAAVLAAIVALVKEALRGAVLTLLAVPDPDRKYLHSEVLFDVVRKVSEAYGWTDEILRFHPTPHNVKVYLDVLEWLAWYRRERDADVVRLFMAWAVGAPWKRLSRQFDKTERTLRYWIDDMCLAIWNEFQTGCAKILLDEFPEMRKLLDSSGYGAQCAPIPTIPEKSLPYWIADGEQSSLDTSIPAVAEDRQKLVERLERGNRRRAKAKRRRR